MSTSPPPVSAPPSAGQRDPGSEQDPTDHRRAVLREVLLVFGAATLICAGLWQAQRFVPLIQTLLQGLIAGVFLFLPTEVLIRRNLSFREHGLTAQPIGRGLIVFAVAAAIVFPLFSLGFYGYYQIVCGQLVTRMSLPGQIRRFCSHYVGHLSRAQLKLPPDVAELTLNQLVGVALPEEYFFRGYVQSRLEQVWPSRRRLWGAPVGRALLLAAVLFALGHVLVDFNGLRLAVFFPALVFGWMRQATGSILAGSLFHAASNLVIDVLQRSFLQ